MAGVAITRTDMSAADLRAAAKRSANARQASRILAIAMVLDGFSQEEAARLCGMDRQTLRNWILTALAAAGVHTDRLAQYYPAAR